MPSIETTDELISSSVEPDIHKYAKIRYFSEILTRTYNTPYGATTWHAQSVINEALKERGFLDFDSSRKAKYLIDLAFENFPEWWLKKIYEDAHKEPGKNAPSIDNAFRFMDWRHYEYALAIALLLAPEEWASYQMHDDVLISIHGIERVNEHVWTSIT